MKFWEISKSVGHYWRTVRNNCLSVVKFIPIMFPRWITVVICEARKWRVKGRHPCNACVGADHPHNHCTKLHGCLAWMNSCSCGSILYVILYNNLISQATVKNLEGDKGQQEKEVQSTMEFKLYTCNLLPLKRLAHNIVGKMGGVTNSAPSLYTTVGQTCIRPEDWVVLYWCMITLCCW